MEGKIAGKSLKKQRKLLTTEEKEKICNSRRGVCTGAEDDKWCPLFLGIGIPIFCYKDISEIEEIIKNMHNKEVEFNA